MDSTDILEHYGIKGMRWGVRRSRSELAKLPDSSDDYRKSVATRQKIANAKPNKDKTRVLTNAELRTLNERMQLEENYLSLISKEKKRAEANSPFKKGQQAVDKALSVGKTINDINNFVNSPVGKKLRQQMG